MQSKPEQGKPDGPAASLRPRISTGPADLPAGPLWRYDNHMDIPHASARITINRAGIQRAGDFDRAISGAAVTLRITCPDADYLVMPIQSTVEGERDEIVLDWSFPAGDDPAEEAEHKADVLRSFEAAGTLRAEAEDACRKGVYRFKALAVTAADARGVVLTDMR